MKAHSIILSALFLAAKGVVGSESPPPCPAFSGDLTVKLPNIFPEGVDFSPSNCKIYVGSLNNNSLVEYNPYNSTTEIIEFPGISHNWEYFVCGVDYSYATQTLYISASARAPWFNPGSDNMGTNLTGPNHLIHYSPSKRSILWMVDINPVVQEIEQEFGTSIGGFQDSAEDNEGNAYFPSSFGDAILKVDVNGNVSKFYVADDLGKKDTSAYGFGGLFTTQHNTLVLSHGVSQSFLVFNLSGPNASEPFFSKPTGVPAEYATNLNCDCLITPRKFDNTIALCADVFDTNLSPRGVIAAYASPDGWKTSEYIGIIPVEFSQHPDVWSTAQFTTGENVYALSSSLPYEKGTFPETGSTTLVDITERVDELVRNRKLFQDKERGSQREEL